MQKHKAQYSLSVQASTEHLAEVRDFVATHALKFGFNKQAVSDMRLAVDEAFTNIIKHAYKNDPQQSVDILLGYNGNTFWISLLDSGQSFSKKDYEKPDLKKKIRQKERGGVGVYLIKKLMDEVKYFQTGAFNEIRMTKKR